MLLESAGDVLDPDKVVIELLETVPPDDEVVAACRDLVGRGFRIAMDDFVFGEEYLPLLELAHIVKLDVLAHSMEELHHTVEQLRPYGKILLAEKRRPAACWRTPKPASEARSEPEASGGDVRQLAGGRLSLASCPERGSACLPARASAPV